MTYVFDNESVESLLIKLQNDDIVEIRGEDLLALLRKAGSTRRGRKPIEIDDSVFNEIVTRWHNGEMTAREAMEKLNLKPNTFYRRVEERTGTEMKDIKEEIRGIAKIEKQALRELREQADKNLKDMKETIDEKKELLDMEKDIRRSGISARISHLEDVGDLKDQVAKETKAYKDSQK